MATEYRIHPAIGIARVGNSPDEFFIGPERRWEQPHPAGGFKDAECRVKRQAARFRIFAHHDDGTFQEITDAEAQITWTVHLANKKAAHPDRGNPEPVADLTIDPGPRTLTGPDQRAVFDTGTITFAGEPTVTVPLGEIRTNDAGQLLVLGGFGDAGSPAGLSAHEFWLNEGWYDDIADGPVSATITLRSDGTTPTVVGAWVISAPPKFAPHIENPINLYDRLFHEMVSFGYLPAPTTTSYTDDIYAFLKSARTIRWVWDIVPAGVHEWAEPVVGDAERVYVFSRIKTPTAPSPYPTDMPRLYALPTPTQYEHFTRWAAGTFTNDWVGPPSPAPGITPDGLDRAALEPCVGSIFAPGIEAGGSSTPYPQAIVEPTNYVAAFRLNHAVVSAGDLTRSMAVPWQADFFHCTHDDLGLAAWWPIPRPLTVFRPGETTSVGWERGIPIQYEWHKLGFIVEQDGGYYESERCEPDTVHLTTPALDFVNIPQGPTVTAGGTPMVREAALAITFEVMSTSAVTLEYAPGGAPSHPQLTAYNTTVSAGPTSGMEVAFARLWVVFQTSAITGAIPEQTVTIQQVGTARQWTVTINANTVARATTATALVLDRSGSMGEDSGDGTTKHVVLQQAAESFLALMLAGDGAGVVRYNTSADALEPVLLLGAGGLTDTNRNAVHDAIVGPGLSPLGGTSIGDGLLIGRGILDDVAGTYERSALVGLTDGKENDSLYISDVAPQIDAKTYAVGFGTPQNTSAPALQALSGNTGGHLLITGAASGDSALLLHKYFVQILASVNAADVVLDPQGTLFPEAVERIPFDVTAADTGIEAILLTPDPGKVDFRLLTPTGILLEPWRALSEPDMHFGSSRTMSFFRLRLPARLISDRSTWSGRWEVVLSLGRPRLDGKLDESQRGVKPRLSEADKKLLRQRGPRHPGRSHAANQPPPRDRANGMPYSVVVHAYSSFGFEAHGEQSGFGPGADLVLRAKLREAGVPFTGPASVWAELRAPDGREERVPLASAGGGAFEARYAMSEPGVYTARVRARSESRRGNPIARERLITAAVWRGGDRDAEEAARPGAARTSPALGEDGRPRERPCPDDPALRLIWHCLCEAGRRALRSRGR
jgi:hypothetical protein